eukprot:12920981-Heterocapsa_arctica.AAC.1
MEPSGTQSTIEVTHQRTHGPPQQYSKVSEIAAWPPPYNCPYSQGSCGERRTTQTHSHLALRLQNVDGSQKE